jgi:hypothetical protein
MTYDTDPSRVRVTHSASIRVGGTIKMGDIRTLAETENVPDSAVVTIRYEGGDQREQTPGNNVITLTWGS